MTHTATVETITAPGPGALAGFRITCTCGDTQTTTVSPHLAADAHLRYHERTGR